ncbi:coiled-coil domain-containing protein 107 isoform X2 [Oryzias melastigma]|uniref:coiled-coil domain-containing protein 107 isoform X2 n=1 Tax=Oryzias melastigma TaxID=30732 RepID=UPI000CF7FF95|nr:coiled-coil domain-containing protein 107 isoform X2 [Oryzias melastigma]
MVLSTSQQVALAFTAVLFMFVVLPRMLGVGTASKEAKLDPRFNRKGPGPGSAKAHPINMNHPGSHQTPESIQQMKKRMEQELKSDKYKYNNKGYVFTLMPLYAIGVGVFAAYKFLKIRSSDDKAQKDKLTKGAKKSVEAENQLNELEQRLAQTERMLNSILTQLDPLTNCVKSVAQEQKNEIMSQLQTIRYLMKKRGMDCPPLSVNASCGQNLDELIESLGAGDASADVDCPPSEGGVEEKHLSDAAAEEEEIRPNEEEEDGAEEEQEEQEMPDASEHLGETDIQEAVAEQPVSGLRRRNRLE